ncbi:hypothetical protein U1Q18_009579 [Sarracenia purpurea var. burkii]
MLRRRRTRPSVLLKTNGDGTIGMSRAGRRGATAVEARRMVRAPESYARPASSVELKVPNQTLVFFHGSLISAANLPHGLFLIRRNRTSFAGLLAADPLASLAPLDGGITVLVAAVALALRMARGNGSVARKTRGRRCEAVG